MLRMLRQIAVAAALVAALVSLVAVPANLSPGTRSTLLSELGIGARAQGMGGACVAIADDADTLPYNAAGLAWFQDMRLTSTCEARGGGYTYGSVAALLPGMGLGVQYFDFGDVSETDENGDVLGSFSYRSYSLLLGAGVSGAHLPILASFPAADMIGVGILGKAEIVRTMAPGCGSGFAFDFSCLLRSPGLRGVPVVTGCSVGALLSNVLSKPVEYKSGTSEAWPKGVAIGGAVEFVERITVAADARSDGSFALGAEWRPTPSIAIRTGLSKSELLLWSMGFGVRFKNMVMDMAVVPHPYLGSQVRVAFGIAW